MTDRRSEKNGGNMSKPPELADGARSSNHAIRESEADKAGGEDSSRLSRRKALAIGAVTTASAALPIEAMARTVAAKTAAHEFLTRLRLATQAINELRDIRAEFASCSQRIMRMDPLGAESQQMGWSESILYFEQAEAERRAFNAANNISCVAPDALKAAARQLEIALTRYIFNGTVRPAKPDGAAWARKRQAAGKRWLAGRARTTTTA